MAKPVGLFERDGVYYFRRRVPKELIAAIGRSTIKESLNTKNYEQAKKRCHARAVYWDACFEEARNGSGTTGSTPKTLTAEQARVLVYVAKQDAARRTRYVSDGPATLDEKREMLIEADIEEQELREPGNENAQKDIFLTEQRILATGGLQPGNGGISPQEFAELVRRGLLELTRRAAAQLRDQYGLSHFDHLFAPAALTEQSTASSVTFGEFTA